MTTPEPRIVAEVTKTAKDETILVTCDADGTYAVYRDGIRRHWPCSAEDVICALAFYMETSC